MLSVVTERDPCDEIYIDNFMTFRSAAFEEFVNKCGITQRFRAAYAPGGSRKIERNHITIKRIAEKRGITPKEAICWHNITPRRDAEKGSVLSIVLFKYQWGVLFDVNTQQLDDNDMCKFIVGEEVWVKLSLPPCTRKWTPCGK